MSGKTLDHSGVVKARKMELEYVDKRPVYEEVPTEECLRATGKMPVDTKWVDIDKGGPGAHFYRSRWVAKDFRTTTTDEYFSATPPYEAVKLMLSLAASQRRKGARTHRAGPQERKRHQNLKKLRDLLGVAGRDLDEERRWCEAGPQDPVLKLELRDVSRAHFNGRPLKPTYVQLPPERRKPGVCGRLVSNMYGMRGAAAAWEVDYADNMQKWGFSRGMASTCVFMHTVRRMMVIVHGDDFLCLGSEVDLDWFGAQMSEVYENKSVGRIGPERADKKTLKVLNRLVTWRDDAIELEADQRHADIVVNMMGLAEGKGLTTPGVKMEEAAGDDEVLEGHEATRFRAIAARINFLSLDRPELLYSAKEVCRSMATPTQGSMRKLKRLCRYLAKRPRVVQRFVHQELPHSFRVYCDSDWAACRKTRRSTSGGCVMLGKHTLRSWSSTQSIVALSSGEAEYYAMLKGASVGAGLQAMADEVGIFAEIALYTDSKAASGITHRRGLGKTRHIQVAHLWLQEKVHRQELVIRRVAGVHNPADLMTKYLPEATMLKHMQTLDHEMRQDRHPEMLKVNTGPDGNP